MTGRREGRGGRWWSAGAPSPLWGCPGDEGVGGEPEEGEGPGGRPRYGGEGRWGPSPTSAL